MGCGESAPGTDDQMIMERPNETPNNEPYESMQAIVDSNAWSNFIEWPHHPDDKESFGWEKGDLKVTESK